jgi:hypothetical protein
MDKLNWKQVVQLFDYIDAQQVRFDAYYLIKKKMKRVLNYDQIV